jgi:outer membrane protein OmpA-like peptidoglycan-associated protein
MTSEGEILEFLRYAPEIMSSQFDKNVTPPMPLGPYIKPVQGELPVYVSVHNTTEISNVEGEKNIVAVTKEVKTPSVKMNKNVTPSGTNKGIPQEKEMTTRIVRTEQSPPKDAVITRSNNKKEGYQADLIFQGFSARLTPELILQIEDINEKYTENPKKLIQIRSFVTAGDETNKKLAKNRMDACRDLLVTYGVPFDIIDTGIRPYESSNKGNVSIQLVDELDNQ